MSFKTITDLENDAFYGDSYFSDRLKLHNLHNRHIVPVQFKCHEEEIMEVENNKSFYVVSALQNESIPFGKLQRHTTEKEALEKAKYVIDRRQYEGQRYMPFYVLKVIAKVETPQVPLTVTKLK